MKKKSILAIAIIVLLIILLFPFKINRLKDGGTVEYNALLYKLTDYHKFGTDTEYVEGSKIEILGKEIFNNTIMHHIEKDPETDKRVKLEDLKITAKNIDTTKLVKFDGVLYGKSNALIDYVGDLNKSIGKINFLIGEEYMPKLDGETNCKELFNASVLEANGKSMVLNVNNEAVPFESIDKENIKKKNGESLDNAQNTEYSSFVGTVLEETTKYMIVEPNEDEEERKSSDKIKINYGTEHIDYLYGVGRKVVIFYNGFIMESYPAQIETDNISIDGYEDFKTDKITATKRIMQENKASVLNEYKVDIEEKTAINYILEQCKNVYTEDINYELSIVAPDYELDFNNNVKLLIYKENQKGFMLKDGFLLRAYGLNSFDTILENTFDNLETKKQMFTGDKITIKSSNKFPYTTRLIYLDTCSKSEAFLHM